MYLEAKKEETRYRVTYLRFLIKGKGTIDVLKAKGHHEK